MRALLALLVLCFAGFPTDAAAAQGLIRFQGPPTLAFEDLVRLAAEDPPLRDVQTRLDRLLSQPFISNEAALAGVTPNQPNVPGIGPVLRIAEWNINRGMNAMQIKTALLPGAQFSEGAHNPDAKRRAQLHSELENLRGADAVILDEVDRGVKRTEYRDVTRDLAEALHMNYAYGVEFIELERIYLGIRRLDLLDRPRQARAAEMFGVDPRRYLGLEGIAVLSRYPIRSAKILRLPEVYDWYQGEIQQISDLERVKRWSADKLFDEQVKRQVRRGGRIALIVNLGVPDSPTGVVTLVCPHLEDYSTPKGRRKQMDYTLRRIVALKSPVVVTGDLNTMGHNQEPTSVKKIILEHLTDYRFWIRQAILRLNPIGIYNYLLYPVNYFKNYHDPTALNFYLFLPNHEKPLFNDVRRFRFADGTQFDFAGQEVRSFQHRGRTLSDSSQRAWKGFSTTFAFNRPLFHLVGHYKLDWFFVKPAATDCSPSPYFGQALQEVNQAVAGRISDHCPITVDLPLTR